MTLLRHWALLFGCLVFAPLVHSDDVRVAAASNIIGPMQSIAAAFEAAAGHPVKVSYGSSGKLYAQIQHGAPFDVFFSADQDKPARLEAADMILKGSRYTYAIGQLALWSANKQAIDANASLLLEGRFRKLAIANPRLAPYGVAAVEVLDRLNLTNDTRPRWVQGENIAQTYQFVSTGNADLGFVAVSQIIVDGRLNHGSAWIVPEDMYTPIKQDAVLLKRAQNSAPAQAFLTFVKSPAATDILRSFGYQIPVGER